MEQESEDRKVKIEIIIQELIALGTTNQVSYYEKVTPGCKPVVGVRIPKLRLLAKRIAKEDYRFFLENCPDVYFELEMLQAFVIGYAKDDIDTILSYADRFIPKIHDWCVNDSFCQNFAIAGKNRETVFAWLEQYIEKEEEFSQRMAAVMLMSHFMVEEYIDKVLNIMNRLQYPGYYTKMGVAWCIATAYAKFPKETYAFMVDNQLDDWTYNKAIQKMRESYRITLEDKVLLRKMKR